MVYGLKILLNEFISNQNYNEFIFTKDLQKTIKKSSILNQNIENSVGWEKVLMILGEYIVFTDDSVLIYSQTQQQDLTLYKIPELDSPEKKGLKLKKSGWLQYFFEIDYLNIDKLSGKPQTGGGILWKKSSDMGYFSFDKKLICFISKKENPLLPIIEELKIKIKSLTNKNKIQQEEEQKLKKEQQRLKEEQRLKELQVSQNNILSELDKDGNGEVDVIEGNDFNLLLKKHQKIIVEIDRTYVQQFVKISGYLKIKEKNVQSIFNLIKDTPNQEVLNEYVEILKDDIHSYNLMLFNSLNMIVSLVEDDMITFYEIHEMFDTLNMFDSKHEKDVSQKLTNIGDGLKDLMYEVRSMGNKICNSIQELSYVNEESNRQLTNKLSEIDSTMKVGNLISTINTYQNYKTNKRLSS